MTAAIVVYVLIVTLPLVAAAALTERVFRLWSWPVRGIWAATALLIALVGIRAIVQQSVAPATASMGSIRIVNVAEHASVSNASRVERIIGATVAIPRAAGAFAAHALGPAQNRILAILWCIMSIAMLALVCIVYVRVWRIRGGWRTTDFAGARVRVSPRAGPAVVGILRPEIVVPHWMLECAPEDSQLVVMHEMEHRNARDPLLLASMWTLVALIPWHPGAWYCLARTRLAIELDCDARVVRRGASLKAYAHLLVNQARMRLNAPGHMWLGATSLLEPSSHLERRLNAMILPDENSRAQRPITRYLRTFACLTIVSTIAIAACESHVPTAADITGLDVASAERNARQASILSDQPVIYYVDDIKVSADSAHAINAADITGIMVSRVGPQQEVRVTMPDSDSILRRRAWHVVTDSPPPPVAAQKVIVRMSTHAFAPDQPGAVVRARQPFAGAVFIDGVASDLAAMNALDPRRIATVEVLKGPAAIATTTDPRAVNGIIRITLKH